MRTAHHLRFAGTLATALVIAGYANAAVLDLSPCAFNTATDLGQEDGVFDVFDQPGTGSINNNGYTSYATSMEFCLSALPAGAIINSANVLFYIRNFQGENRSLGAAVYAGDGTITLSDFVPSNISRTWLVPYGVTAFNDNITALLPSLGPVVGYALYEQPPNTSNFTVMSLALVQTDVQAPPVLRLDYTIGQPFAGFFAPVDNPPLLNAMKAGAAVPVKFSLGGDRGLDVIADGFPTSEQVACPGGAPVASVQELTVTAGGSTLHYDAATDMYIYAWKTDKAWAGSCRSLNVRLTDGTDHTALFIFK